MLLSFLSCQQSFDFDQFLKECLQFDSVFVRTIGIAYKKRQLTQKKIIDVVQIPLQNDRVDGGRWRIAKYIIFGWTRNTLEIQSVIR